MPAGAALRKPRMKGRMHRGVELAVGTSGSGCLGLPRRGPEDAVLIVAGDRQ